MKKLLVVFVVAILLVSCSFIAFGAEKVTFSAEDTSTKNNRIFTLTIKGTGNEKLSAGRFDFTYNSDFIEFRQAKATADNSKIKTRQNGGRLHLIFLNEKGIDLQNSPELFTIDFKAQNLTAAQEIAFEVSDCVNNKVESVSATGGKAVVSLMGGAVTDTATSKNNATSEKATTASNQKAAANEKSDSEETAQAVQNEELQNSPEQTEKMLVVGERDNTLQIFAAGGVMMFVLISLCAVSYHIGKKSKDKDENSDEK